MANHGKGDADRDTVEVNVGYDGTDGKNAAMDAAVEVVREFESLEVVTIRISRKNWAELDDHPEIRYVEENGQSGA